jgi:hypothetical protein
LDSSSTIIFTLLHDSSFGNNVLGKVDIRLGHFLELQRLQPNEGEYRFTVDRDATIDNCVKLDVVLPLADKKGNPSPAQLSVRVIQDSMSAVAGVAVDQRAQASAQKLTGLVVVATAPNAATDISNAVSNQQNIITPFESFMKKIGILVTIGDQVSKACPSISSPLLHNLIVFCLKKKIHPYVNLAWKVLSAGMKACHFLLLMFFSRYISVRSDDPSPTGSRPADSRSCHCDGEHLLVHGFRRRIKEPACSSGYRRTNTEANDRMWVFHSGVYATRLWRYVTNFFERHGGELKIEQRESLFILSLT